MCVAPLNGLEAWRHIILLLIIIKVRITTLFFHTGTVCVGKSRTLEESFREGKYL